jgi:hypothetical protein
MINSNDIIGNRTHDFSACREVSQPTAPPMCRERSPKKSVWLKILMKQRVRVQVLWGVTSYRLFPTFLRNVGKHSDIMSYRIKPEPLTSHLSKTSNLTVF